MAGEGTVRCTQCGKRNRLRPSAEGVPRCGSCGAVLTWIVEANDETFDDEVASSLPVLVDFWAPWCGPCRMVTPVVERLAGEHAGRLKVVEVNVDGSPRTAGRFEVRGIPLLVLLRDGQEVDRLVGAVPEPQLRAWLDERLAATGSAN
jgi:thioredoxin 2